MNLVLAVFSLFVPTVLNLGVFPSFAQDLKNQPQVIASEQGDFSVALKKEERKIEVSPVPPKGTLPPYLRMRILRDKEPPLEIRLQTMRRNDIPLKYSAQVEEKRNSYVGLELEFSFDQKSWKKLGQSLSRFFVENR